jgi:two-component system nitrogen regulation sensor histidine kinase GlnL
MEVRGRPYFEVLPRLFAGDGDAVAEVIATGQPVFWERHRFPCFFGTVEADVRIDPVTAEAVDSPRARVRLDVFSECRAMSRLRQSRHLVDIGKTASILSHGVRNPLNAIKGAVVYLKNRYRADDNLLEFTGIMEDEIARLDKFISGFLSTSFLSFDQNRNDVNALLKKLDMFVSLQAKAAGVSITFAYGSVPPVCMNIFQIEHAILNILNNAIHALPEGGQVSVASRYRRRDGKGFVMIEIIDNGPGMPERSVDEFAAPREEVALAEGKGFGLFIAREVLQHHGGSLDIQSTRDQGTRVSLLLPVEEGAEE